MKKFFTATAIVTGLLVSGVAHADLSPEQMAAADQIRDARNAERLAFQTKASKAAYNNIVKTLDTKVPGRSCDADDWSLVCEMEDGKSISMEAVPVNTSEAKAKELCTNPYAGAPDAVVSVGPNNYVAGIDKTKVELKGDPKQKFLMLWCTTEARDWSVAAANKRIEAVKPLAKMDASEDQDADGFKIKLGKRSNAYGIGISQNLTVTNNGSGRWSFVMVDCTFYYKGDQVGTGGGIVANLYPGKTKPLAAMGLQIDKTDEVTCSIGTTMN